MAFKNEHFETGTTGYYIGSSKRKDIETTTTINDISYHDREGRLEWNLLNNSSPLEIDQILEVPNTAILSSLSVGSGNVIGHNSFGYDVDICNGHAVVGAPGSRVSGYTAANTGAAYIFELSRKVASPGSNLLKVLRYPSITNGYAHEFGRCVACGFGKVAVAAKNSNGPEIFLYSFDGLRDSYNESSLAQTNYIQINAPDTLPYYMRTTNTSVTSSTSLVTLYIKNWSSGMTIGENALYVTADVTIGASQNEGDAWYSALFVYSLSNGDLLNYSIADFMRPAPSDGIESDATSLRSDIPPLTGGNFNETGINSATFGAGEFSIGRTEHSTMNYNEWDFFIPNNRIAVGSDRVVVGAPLWSPNSNDLAETIQVGVGNAYVFDISGNYMYNLFDRPANQFGNFMYKGATVSIGMGIIGVSGANIPDNNDDRQEFAFFHADTNYRHILYPYIGDLGDDDISNDYARYAGRTGLPHPPSTATYRLPDGRNCGMLLAGGVRFLTVGVNDVPKAKISILDADGMPYLKHNTSDPNAETFRTFSTSTISGYNAYDKCIFGKMKQANGKMITSSNYYSSVADQTVLILKWPMRTHSKDMMEHMR